MNKLWKIGWILILVVMVAASGYCNGSSTNGDNPALADEGIVNQTSVDGGTISFNDGYVLVNNTWNKKATMGAYTERVFTKDVNGQTVLGWDWHWGASNSVVAYPEVFYGDTPWDSAQASVPGLPFLAGSKNVSINFNVNLRATGIYNMAFEFWVVSKVPAASTDITHEVMIWNKTSGMTPAGTRKGKVTFDGVTYDVYQRVNHGDASGANANKWSYIAFQARKPILNGPLNVSNFINYLIDKGILNRTLYVTTMEFGNEIIQGSGKTEISNYSVNIQ